MNKQSEFQCCFQCRQYFSSIWGDCPHCNKPICMEEMYSKSREVSGIASQFEVIGGNEAMPEGVQFSDSCALCISRIRHLVKQKKITPEQLFEMKESKELLTKVLGSYKKVFNKFVGEVSSLMKHSQLTEFMYNVCFFSVNKVKQMFQRPLPMPREPAHYDPKILTSYTPMERTQEHRAYPFETPAFQKEREGKISHVASESKLKAAKRKKDSEKKKLKDKKDFRSQKQFNEDNDSLEQDKNKGGQLILKQTMGSGINKDQLALVKDVLAHKVMKKPMYKVQKHYAYTEVFKVYWELIFRLVAGFSIIALVAFLMFMVKNDIDEKVAQLEDKTRLEIENCTREYYSQQCDNKEFVNKYYGIKMTCNDLEKCMNRNAKEESKHTTESIKLLAEGLNGFFDHLSSQTIKCLFLFIFLPMLVWICCMKTKESAPYQSVKNIHSKFTPKKKKKSSSSESDSKKKKRFYDNLLPGKFTKNRPKALKQS